MKESEKAENNVDARAIIASVLAAVGMKAPKFAEAIGINYQRIFDLQRGRTKKFNPGVVNLICAAFPQINKSYLFTGEGNVLNTPQEDSDAEAPIEEVAPADPIPAVATSSDTSALLHRVMEMFEEVNKRAVKILDQERELLAREKELLAREAEISRRESELGIPSKKIV